MLEPREADIPVLFLVLVVLPLVAYIWLGKWSEGAKKRERVSLLAHLAAQEAFRAESMATVVPLVSSSSNVHRECARCFSPATTRCSRCKSVRYCSGKCQIMHWREAHKKECLQLDYSSSPRSVLVEESVHDGALLDRSVSSQLFGHNSKPTLMEKAHLDSLTYPLTSNASTTSSEVDISQVSVPERRAKEKRVSRKSNREMSRREDGTVFDSLEDKFIPDKGNGVFLNCEAVELNRSLEATAVMASVNGTNASRLHGNKTSKPSKSTSIGSGDHLCAEAEGKGHIVDETKISRAKRTFLVEGSNGDANTGIMKMLGLRKAAKSSKYDAPEAHSNRHKKMKMLFPYEEFLKMFQCEIFNLMPRGLMNCGNSCYANAVMQCLTCTKPLITYLLHRSHSRSCCMKGWCLMCELEQHVMMLREGVGPLSLSKILSHMQSTNCQIGNGSQEDAHEFLRLLVASMQSICLEGLGGENKVDPRLQETTFIQHTFGGRLRSKVKCLGCHHESERYENIMDLTLEIYGWVESLEDALTQFTTPEDLDGENMYRCGRCAAYVRARKQLSIHEAPNVLTIVLKRFQEGRYGKINKWITFPDLLDMIPFMTGMDDMPPLYLLYAVVVHLDTLNASFSGHYISYVKDSQGNWFRIDDTEVQQVPMSQVMSEGAYILFYMRSFPRPQRASASKARQQSPARHSTLKVSRYGQVKCSNDFIGSEPLRDKRAEYSMEFSDATSSDWSLFTSSDEASFTTESTRDSFSTVDYADACKDPISSIFNTTYDIRPQTRFVSEKKGYVSSSYQQPLDKRIHRGDRSKQVSHFSTSDGIGSNYELLARYGSNPIKLSLDRTCKL